MKLITLNIWGGRACKDSGIFDKYSDTDIWCFQEVYKDATNYYDATDNESDANRELFKDIESHLKSHKSNFCQVLDGIYGISTFLKDEIQIVSRGELLVAKGAWEDTSDMHNRDHHRKLQWFEIMLNGKKILLMNVHLTHRPQGKMDSEKRLNQSKIICDFMNMFDCPKILVGDFNLLPDTESINMIEKAGMRNLVKEYDIKSTRTELYGKPLQFADYIFVSKEIEVVDFKVLPDVVSDHSPLFLEFEVK
ncbi:MAG: endonuclease/exonuclease/phosphatase family protein [Minisyncoccia bacterium]